MKKVLFIDRDGTLIQEPPITFQINSLEEMVFLPKVISSLVKLQKAGYELIIVTNQDGLGTESNPRENYQKINKKMFEIFKGEGVVFPKIFECPHFPEDNCDCRKPKVGILGDFLEKNDIDLEKSYMIGDRDSDKEFAKNIGVKFERVVFDSKDYNWEKVVENINTPILTFPLTGERNKRIDFK